MNSRNSPTEQAAQRRGAPPHQPLGLDVTGHPHYYRTANEFVKRLLHHKIVSGQLPAGTRLVQADIAAELNVSTTPVREALRDLATQGMIQLDPHRGAVVREVDIEEVREIYELRQLLEPFAIGQAAHNIIADQWEYLSELCVQMDATQDPFEWIALNREFHAGLIEAAQRPKLASILANFVDAAAAYVALAVQAEPGLRQSGGDEHAAILDALKKGDVNRAESITTQHLRSTLDVIESIHRDWNAEESSES